MEKEILQLKLIKDEHVYQLPKAEEIISRNQGINYRMVAVVVGKFIEIKNVLYNFFLLDWLLEVCESNKFSRETFYLAHNYLMRYLSLRENVGTSELQMIGTTCLDIAAKVEEVFPPKISYFAEICGNKSYSIF